MLSRQELFASLRLSRSRGIGAVTYIQLTRRFGSAEKALAALPNFLAEKQASGRIKLAPEDQIYRELEQTEHAGITLLPLADPAYPASLKAIPDPPPVLGIMGNLAILDRPGIAIVGARNASSAGRRMAAELARNLGEAGWIITSGLARGIDGAAHQAALSTGTIAVLAGGIDNIYPPQHESLYHGIADQGAIISEMRYGHTATARDFPKRNRIVSGLTKGVIVVEAAERSGTLITARLALEQGREVCAVPGSPLDPRSAGTNRLIRQGAALIRDADDVIEALGNRTSSSQCDLFAMEEPAAPLEGNDRAMLEAEIRNLLSLTPTHRDELLRESGASPAQFADILLDLVLSDEAKELPGGMFALSSSA